MKLTATKRAGNKKSELTRLRAAKEVPAVFYIAGKENQLIALDGSTFRKILQNVERGHLSTMRIELDIEGKSYSCLVREIQYHPTTYAIEHVDLQGLDETRLIDVNVPIRCLNVVDSVGIKLGGFKRDVKRHVRVRCLPKDMPSAFDIDIKGLNIGGTVRVRDLSIPSEVKPLVGEKEVLITIAKR
ncbi:MAG: 50S ribosomal protein L25 [Simkaniaceae bacterium]